MGNRGDSCVNVVVSENEPGTDLPVAKRREFGA